MAKPGGTRKSAMVRNKQNTKWDGYYFFPAFQFVDFCQLW